MTSNDNSGVSMGGTDHPIDCDSCGKSLVSFSMEKLEDGTCPFCLDQHSTDTDTE